MDCASAKNKTPAVHVNIAAVEHPVYVQINKPKSYLLSLQKTKCSVCSVAVNINKIKASWIKLQAVWTVKMGSNLLQRVLC